MVEQDPLVHRKEQAMPNTNSMQAIVPAAGYYSIPGDPGSLETEVLFGEELEFIEDKDEYVLVKSKLYATPGYVLRTDIQHRYLRPTHRVSAPYVNSYRDKSFKSGVQFTLPMNALLHRVAREVTPEGGMIYFDDAGWIFEDQVRLVDNYFDDYVEVARSRVGSSASISPYTWGGRFYPDCSAFVMDSLLACNIVAPRNVGEQAERMGLPIKPDEILWDLTKGDFVFWLDPAIHARHVVIMTSPLNCVHSSIAAPHRGIVEQPLAEVIAKQKEMGNGQPTMVRRFPTMRFIR